MLDWFLNTLVYCEKELRKILLIFKSAYFLLTGMVSSFPQEQMQSQGSYLIIFQTAVHFFSPWKRIACPFEKRRWKAAFEVIELSVGRISILLIREVLNLWVTLHLKIGWKILTERISFLRPYFHSCQVNRSIEANLQSTWDAKWLKDWWTKMESISFNTIRISSSSPPVSCDPFEYQMTLLEGSHIR